MLPDGKSDRYHIFLYQSMSIASRNRYRCQEKISSCSAILQIESFFCGYGENAYEYHLPNIDEGMKSHATVQWVAHHFHLLVVVSSPFICLILSASLNSLNFLLEFLSVLGVPLTSERHLRVLADWSKEWGYFTLPLMFNTSFRAGPKTFP